MRIIARSLSIRASRLVDMLRVFLVTQVLLGHLAMIALPKYKDLNLRLIPDLLIAMFRMLTRFGPQAAYAFVFLSGFFIVPRLVLVVSSKDQNFRIFDFFKIRLNRIYPTLIFAIFITFICDYLGMHEFKELSFYERNIAYDLTQSTSKSALIGNLLSLQPTFATAYGSNGPLWTLGYLFQFYIFGAFVTWGLVRQKAVTVILATIILCVAIYFKTEWALLLACWVCGGAVRFYSRSNRSYILAIFSPLIFFISNLASSGISIIIVTISSAMLMVYIMNCNEPVDDNFARRSKYISSISYSVYALHFPIAILMFAYLNHIGISSGFYGMVWQFPLAILLIMALASAWEYILKRWYAGGGMR